MRLQTGSRCVKLAPLRRGDQVLLTFLSMPNEPRLQLEQSVGGGHTVWPACVLRARTHKDKGDR